MSDEPVNTRQLLQAVTDDVWDVYDVDDEAKATWFIAHVEEPVRALICQHDGHVVVNDQCMIPEHRYCVVCAKGMPNEPISGPAEAVLDG